MQAVFAPLALSHNASNLHLFGGTASTEFVRLNEDFSDEVLVATVSLVKSQAHVSPDDAYVYYTEFNGNIHQASTEDLMDNWVMDLGVPIEGEFALNNEGTILYIGDVTGLIQAFRVGSVPTDSPTAFPTGSPTIAPTRLPTSGPASRPSLSPTVGKEPTQRPTIQAPQARANVVTTAHKAMPKNRRFPM